MSDGSLGEAPGVAPDDLSPAEIARAIEANDTEFLMALGRAGGAHVRDDSRLRWTFPGGSRSGECTYATYAQS